MCTRLGAGTSERRDNGGVTGSLENWISGIITHVSAMKHIPILG